MNKTTRLHLLLPAVALLLLAALSATARKPSRWEHDAVSRKADYIFLEATNAQLRGDNASSYALLKYAHELNPADDELAANYAVYKIALEMRDSASVADAMAMMRRYFDAHPEDLYASVNYALFLQRFGEIDEARRVYRTIHRLFPERSGITHRYAETLVMSGLGDSALAVYDSLEITDGPSIELTGAKLNVLFGREDTAAIINEGRRLLARSPRNPEYNTFMGNIYASLDMNDSALACFDRACALDTTNAGSYYARAGFYHHIGDSVAFDREIFHVLKMEELDMDTKMEVMRSYVSELYTDSLQSPRILDLFKSMVEIHPHEAELREFYAAYLYIINNYKEAAAQQERAMDLQPADETGWLNLVSFDIRADEMNRALADVDRGLHYFPESGRLFVQRAAVNMELGSTDSAIADFKTALEYEDSTDVELYSNIHCMMADTYYQAGQIDSAMTYYSIAVEENPFNYLAANNYAYSLARTGENLDEALALIERALSSDEAEMSWVDTYAWVLFRRKEYEKAREQIDKVVGSGADDVGAVELEHAGDIYFFVGEPAVALDFWKKALVLDPDNTLLKKKVHNKTYYYE